MAHIYLDDSKHHHRGFSLATFVVCETDPSSALTSMILDAEFDPQSFEFKSSAIMQNNPRLQSFRDQLMGLISKEYRVAVCVVKGDEFIGEASLQLLQKVLGHRSLDGGKHEVYFDQGLFQSEEKAKNMAGTFVGLDNCNFHFEQDSKHVLGIQLADLVAHTCATILSEKLGFINKKVKIDSELSGYEDADLFELGFMLWAALRYNFLGENKSKTLDPNDPDFAMLSVEPYGLHVHNSTNESVEKAARHCFGEMYVGCIH